MQVLGQRPAPREDAKLIDRLSRSVSNLRVRPGSRASVAPLRLDSDESSSAARSGSAADAADPEEQDEEHVPSTSTGGCTWPGYYRAQSVDTSRGDTDERRSASRTSQARS